jgi:hypothetical protein
MKQNGPVFGAFPESGKTPSGALGKQNRPAKRAAAPGQFQSNLFPLPFHHPPD